MFSGQFYEKRLSVREMNMKLLLEAATYIAIKESHLHNYNRRGHVHNALQKTSNCITATETVTCIIATERSSNIPVTESNTRKAAKMQQTF